jgi:O-methyltransferase
MSVSGYYIVTLNQYKLVQDKYGQLSANSDFYDKAKVVIKPRLTCLSYDRLYVLYQVMSNFFKPNVVEVGTYKGGGSYFMASIMGGGNLWCFDTFKGHVSGDISENDNLHKVGSFSDTNYDDVVQLLSPFKFVQVWMGKFQDTCDMAIGDKKIDVAHIDVDIYIPTLHALKFISERMSKNGIIVVDDYGVVTCAGVKKAVDEFMADNKNFYFLHLTTGQCLLVKI